MRTTLPTDICIQEWERGWGSTTATAGRCTSASTQSAAWRGKGVSRLLAVSSLRGWWVKRLPLPHEPHLHHDPQHTRTKHSPQYPSVLQRLDTPKQDGRCPLTVGHSHLHPPHTGPGRPTPHPGGGQDGVVPVGVAVTDTRGCLHS